MPFKIDPEVAAGVQARNCALPEPKSFQAGDWQSRRHSIAEFLRVFAPPENKPKDVVVKEFKTKSYDGAEIDLRWYEKHGSKPGSAIVYIHGGGMFAGSAKMYEAIVGRYVSQSGVPALSVEYRLAPEHPAPTPVEDAYAGLVWLHEHVADLGVDPKRIAIMGDSGGGGIAASLAHLAKEKGGPGIAKQILIYPMLDDRNVESDDHLTPFLTWTTADNETGWGALLGERRGKEGVPPKDAPGRMTDATGLPPMYIDTGELDLFRDETYEYARKFGKAGVNVEMHVYPGCPHAFEHLAPTSKVAKQAYANRTKAMQTIEPL